jgi:hypothetical protein
MITLNPPMGRTPNPTFTEGRTPIPPPPLGGAVPWLT